MALGLGPLGWAPGAFWAATPREFIAAAEGRFGRERTEPATRAVLHQLMMRFPDGDPNDPALRT